jgi:adenylosuccinate synthase
MNRLRERNRGDFKHGSCGMGIGETRSDDLRFNDSLRAKDLKSFSGLWNKLDMIRARKVAEAQNEFGDEAAAYLAADEVYRVYEAHRQVERHMIIERQSPLDEQNVIFEGSQGILIDETLGTAPYNTWSDVTPTNALQLSSQSLHVVGVVSKIWSRHGAGPFPTEASGVRLSVDHNRFNEWQGGVRYGWFDHDLFKSVLRSVRVDSLSVTKLDIAIGSALDVDELDRPVLIKSYGRTHNDKTWVTR